MKIYINGKFYDKKDAKVSVFDHGFLYGDGVFEGVRVYNRLIFKLNEHVAVICVGRVARIGAVAVLPLR